MNIKRILLSAVLSAGMLLSCAGCSGSSSSSGNVDEITFAEGDKIAVIEIKDYGTMKAKLFPDIAPIGVENFVRLAESGYYNGLKIHRVVKDNIIQGGSLYGDGTGGSAAFTGSKTDSDSEESTDTSSTFPIEVSESARNFYGALGYAADSYGENAVQFYIVNNKTPLDIRATDADKVQAKADELASEAEAATWEESSSKAKLNSYQQSYYSNNASMLSSKDEKAAAKYSKVGGVYQYDGGYTVFGQVYEGLDVLDKISSCDVQTNAQGEKSMPVEDIIISSVTIEIYSASTAEAEGDSDSKATSGTADVTAQASSTGEAAQSTAEQNTAAAEAVTTAAEQTSQAAEESTAKATEEAALSTIDTVETAQAG